MIKDGRIFKIVKNTCKECRFSHLAAYEVARTTYKGIEPEFWEEVQSPFYFHSKVTPEGVIFWESQGGGNWSSADFNYILKLSDKWFLVARKIVNKTEGEPYWARLTPHPAHIYRQTGGDRGNFVAIEGEPLEWDREVRGLCKRCKAEVEKKRCDRENLRRFLTVDQKIGCQRVLFDTYMNTLHCKGYELPLNDGGIDILPSEAEYVTDGLRLSIGKIYLATLVKDGTVIRAERRRP